MTPAADIQASPDGERRRQREVRVSVRGADQLLLPPRQGLPWLRGDDIGAQTLNGGGLSIAEGRISALEPDPRADMQIDASGCAVIPGFVDCHTHLPFAGWREGEYDQKLRGVPYEKIARGGGGIAASARALGESSDEAVLSQARTLADEMLANGTTCFETKSGYGLSRDGELRALRLARELENIVAQTTLSTALLAHSVPPGYDAAGWMGEVEAMMPEVLALGSVSALDIFVESIAFSNEDLETMGALAAAAGLALRCHVEQLGGCRSVPVALAAGARSVDHLSTLAAKDIAPLAAADCAAVLLPAAEFLGAEQRAPGRALLDAGALVVLATDLNPGTAPVGSMPLVMGLAARLYGMNVLETLAAATLNAAWVLGMERTLGTIEVGKRADLLLLDGPAQRIAYRLGHNPVLVAIVAGEPVYVRDANAAARIGRGP
jgi:imidazolonepropionase